ncbi:histidine kinase [Nostoc sp. 'Peltigera membranacea cyanobiont' 232]|nr:histidine kinase [Nostoc sp. 'Peltigera membranacea cyanobiont' 232]
MLKVLGMREPVKLESIYTAVQFLGDDAIRSFESIENLEKVYRQAKNRGFQSHDGKKQAGIKVANDKQYLMVLGGPGAGKSTFVRKMGLEALKGKKGGFEHACIPVFIELKTFASSNINIEKFIAKEFHTCGFPSPDQFTAKALEKGKLLILLDGLDEVPTKSLTEAISEIQNFVDKYDKNRFISSCRTAAYRSSFRRFSDVGMADFDDDQIQQFIDNWFHCEADKQAKTGEKCWELLQKPEHEAAKELAHTPLLLTFICLVYDRSQNFPDNRSVLYRKALRILLEEWASEKRILRDEIYQGLHTELEEILLSEIAYTGFESDRLFFSQRDIVGQIKTFLASNLNAPQHLDGESVLDAIAIQQGILVERAEHVFSFSHLTLQEYLTAQYIDDHRQIEKLVTEHLTVQRWKEVFLLVAGLMRGGADDLLLLMEKEAQKYINTPKLQALLNWAEQVTAGSPGDFKPVGKRAVAIAIANAIANANANAYAYAYANAEAIANPIAIAYAYAYAYANANAEAIAEAINYSRKLEKLKIFNDINFTVLIARLEALRAKVPNDQQPTEVRLAFAKHLQKTLLNAFNLTLEMINLSEEEAKALGDYLYANHLIMQCKQAAVRVSPQTWEAIEARMLLVL